MGDMADVPLGPAPRRRASSSEASVKPEIEYDDGVVLERIYPLQAGALRELLLFKDTSQDGLYTKFLRKMKYFDIEIGAWSSDDLQTRERKVCFKIANPMGSMGPKQVDAEDSQILRVEDGEDVVMESSLKTSKVMYSNAFR